MPYNTTDEYLAAVDPDERAVLEELRATIRSIVPDAEECLSYGLPAFSFEGRKLVAFGAASKHCAFYPMSSETVAQFAEERADYDTSKGTVRFGPESPLPRTLVRKLVKARIAENRAKG